MVLEIQLLDGSIAKLVSSISWNTLDSCKVVDVLLDRHVVKDCVGLWAVADQLFNLVEVLASVQSANINRPLCWFHFGSQTLESRRFSSTIDTEKGEALSSL